MPESDRKDVEKISAFFASPGAAIIFFRKFFQNLRKNRIFLLSVEKSAPFSEKTFRRSSVFSDFIGAPGLWKRFSIACGKPVIR